MFVIHETYTHIFSKVGHLTSGYVEEEPVLFTLVVCHGILSVRRERETTDAYIFLDEFLRTILHIDQVEVYRTAIIPLRLDAILLVIAYEYPICLLFVRYVHVWNIKGTQLYELVLQRSVDVSSISTLHVAVLVEQLNSLQVVFVPCPDIELRLFEFGEGSILFQWFRSSAEEESLTVLAERNLSVFADNPSFLKTSHLVVGSLLEVGILDVIEIDVDVLLRILGSIGIGIESHGTYFAEGWSLELRTLCTFQYGLTFAIGRIVKEETCLAE